MISFNDWIRNIVPEALLKDDILNNLGNYLEITLESGKKEVY